MGGDGYEKGAAYIYKNQKGMYLQQQLISGALTERAAGLSYADYLPTPQSDWSSHFGFDVAVGPQNLIAVASRGVDEYGGDTTSAVAIYHPNDDLTSWVIRDVQTGIVDKMIDVGGGNFERDTIHLGQSLAFDKELSGTTQWLVAGAPLAGSGANEMGNVHVRYGTKGEVNSFVGYPLDMTNTEVAGATVHDANERFGTSVAMHGNLIVAGAPGYSAQSGVAYVYAADGTGPHTAASSWVEVAKLTGATATTDLDGAFGQSIDVHGTTIVVGAPSGSATDHGSVHVFNSAGSAYRKWTHSVELTASNQGTQDRFGSAVSMPNANTIIVSSPFEDTNNMNAGSVYVFTGAGANWSERQMIFYTGSSNPGDVETQYGRWESSLASTQKEIFVGGEPDENTLENVIRYRI